MSTDKYNFGTFHDILQERRQEHSNFLWVSRKLDTELAWKRNIRPKPQWHKDEVLCSRRTKEIILKLCNENGASVEELEHQVRLILDEIGFNKQLKVIRWLGLVLAKITRKIYSGIYVNEESVARLKTVMGNCPVIFAPSHRSYADFILMSYICFTYDLEIPAIAAGMDFHAMWGMGTVLRDTGAFFMRRSFNDDHLYWETFRQYVHQIVTRGDLPIEFFIEGTRSRSCKSLMPKYGLLSMLLKPLFTGEVPDILIVPINISYDRVLEEKLFAFELLGIPKPKESTSGFFKSLSIIKENFGNIFVDFTQPISLKQFFGPRLRGNVHAIGPLHLQQLTPVERELCGDIAHEILLQQRQHAVLTPFNLFAAVYSSGLNRSNSLESILEDMNWLQNILEHYKARVVSGNKIGCSFQDALRVHANLITLGDGPQNWGRAPCGSGPHDEAERKNQFQGKNNEAGSKNGQNWSGAPGENGPQSAESSPAELHEGNNETKTKNRFHGKNNEAESKKGQNGSKGLKVQLVKPPIVLSGIDPAKLKGYRLSDETMTGAIPAVMLQLYVNPCLHYLANSCLVVLVFYAIGPGKEITEDELFDHFRFLHSVFSYEFALYDKSERSDFGMALKRLDILNAIEMVTLDSYVLGENEKLQAFLCSLLSLFVASYGCVFRILQKLSPGTSVDQTDILAEAQRQIELGLRFDERIHPYSLNLDSLTLCLQSLLNIGALYKIKEDGKFKYKTNAEKLKCVADNFEYLTTKGINSFLKNSSVTKAPRFASKL